MSAPSQIDPSSIQDRVSGPGLPRRLAEVPVLQPGKVLDQSEQIRAGWCHRAAQVILAQAVQPGQQRGPALAELAMQDFLHR
jgi:hypothetical protein